MVDCICCCCTVEQGKSCELSSCFVTKTCVLRLPDLHLQLRSFLAIAVDVSPNKKCLAVCALVRLARQQLIQAVFVNLFSNFECMH